MFSAEAGDMASDPASGFEPSGRSGQAVAAAYALLSESGLEGLTIRAVLQRTGMARRAFYDCFAGKDDLVLAVFAHTLRKAADFFAAQAAALPDPMARLHHIVTGIVLGRNAAGEDAGDASDRRGAAFSREHLRLAEARPAELQKAVGPLIALIARHLAEGIAAGQVRDAPVERLATLIYNLVSTTVHIELLAAEDARLDPDHRATLADDIWDFCRRAVAA